MPSRFKIWAMAAATFMGILLALFDRQAGRELTATSPAAYTGSSQAPPARARGLKFRFGRRVGEQDRPAPPRPGTRLRIVGEPVMPPAHAGAVRRVNRQALLAHHLEIAG